MTADPHYPDPAERAELDAVELAVATLVGRYVERRATDDTACVDDLFAAAGAIGTRAFAQLRTIIALYEALTGEGSPS